MSTFTYSKRVPEYSVHRCGKACAATIFLEYAMTRASRNRWPQVHVQVHLELIRRIWYSVHKATIIPDNLTGLWSALPFWDCCLSSNAASMFPRSSCTGTLLFLPLLGFLMNNNSKKKKTTWVSYWVTVHYMTVWGQTSSICGILRVRSMLQ